MPNYIFIENGIVIRTHASTIPFDPLPEGGVEVAVVPAGILGRKYLGLDEEGNVLTEQIAPPTDAAPRHISVGAFKARLSVDERKAIRALAKSDEDVEDYMDLLNSAQFVDLDDARTRGGLQYMESLGVLLPGRAATVLDAEIQPGESSR